MADLPSGTVTFLFTDIEGSMGGQCVEIRQARFAELSRIWLEHGYYDRARYILSGDWAEGNETHFTSGTVHIARHAWSHSPPALQALAGLPKRLICRSSTSAT